MEIDGWRDDAVEIGGVEICLLKLMQGILVGVKMDLSILIYNPYIQ